MPPSAPSVTTSGTASTGLTSTISDNPRSLKNYEALDNNQLMPVLGKLNDINFENCNVCLVTVPNGFPTEKLSEIPIAGDELHDIKISGKWYNVRDTSNTNKIVPIPRNQSRHTCRIIPNALSITKSMKCNVSSSLNFIPRPEFPKISENLIERFVPFGCQVVENNVVKSPKKKKHKKQKRKLQNDDEILDETAVEPPKKKQKRKKSELPSLEENDVIEKCVDVESNVVADTQHEQKMAKKAKKAAKKAKKEAKKAKKKKQ